MIDIYGKGQVCPGKDDKKYAKKCLSLEPDLQDILAHSRDYDEQLWVWKGWRDAVGRKIGKLYPDWVKLKNIAAVNGGTYMY